MAGPPASGAPDVSAPVRRSEAQRVVGALVAIVAVLLAFGVAYVSVLIFGMSTARVIALAVGAIVYGALPIVVLRRVPGWWGVAAAGLAAVAGGVVLFGACAVEWVSRI